MPQIGRKKKPYFHFENRLAPCTVDESLSTPKHHLCGESRIRTYEGVRQQIYSLPQLATLVSPQQTFKELFF